MGEVHGKAQLQSERLDYGGAGFRADLPGSSTADAVEVAVDPLREDVILLSAAWAVAVADQPKVFEHVEGAVDRGWGSGLVAFPAAGDQFGGGDVTFTLP